jgi:hypothetical protein
VGGRHLKEKKRKIHWGELSVPVLFMAFSIGFFVQLIGLSWLSIGFSLMTLGVFVPIVMILIFKFGLPVVRAEKKAVTKKDTWKSWWVRLSPGKVLSFKKTDDSAAKQVRFIILYIFCFAVISYFLGFHAFTFCFSFLSLAALGVHKPVQLLSLTFGITLFMWLIFGKFLMFPLPRGVLF